MLKSKVLLNDKLKLHKEPQIEYNNIPLPEKREIAGRSKRT
jgi:hypothetical protein